MHNHSFSGDNISELIKMPKQGMKRIDRTHTKPKNDVPPVPETQGKAKHGNSQVNPIIAGIEGPTQKVYHGKPHSEEKTISPAYSVIDTDLARDNLENDFPAADIQDL